MKLKPVYLVLGVLVITSLFFPPHTHAIIFFPALFFIPIIKLIAIIIAGIAVPTVGVVTLWEKISGRKYGKVIIKSMLILVVIALVVGGFLKIQNPDRPLF